MTRSIVEARGPRVKGPSTHDTHCWLRNDDRQPIRGGRIEYGNNRVQEIVSGTIQRSVYRFQATVLWPSAHTSVFGIVNFRVLRLDPLFGHRRHLAETCAAGSALTSGRAIMPHVRWS